MSDIQVGPPRSITPHNQGLYEAGKDMLVNSLAVGRDFNNFMVGVSTGAIPIYLALLTLALPDEYRPDWWTGIGALVPAAAFLLAAIFFAIGVFPRTGRFSLDIPSQIDSARSKAISWRRNWAIAGFLVFGLAAIASVVLAVAALKVEKPPSTPEPTLIKIVE